ncbi:MAG TPA: hypothetical protein DCP28_22770, partial [Cytophagales bacterium]|nr:hypothetical protein [Cytophagales bacterium]
MNTPLKSLLVGLALLALLPLQSNAQAWVEASAGTSMAETVVTKFNVGVPLSERWQILGGYRYGQNRYTFIDARPITDGDAMQASLGASVRLSQHGPLQLHAFALAGYRRIEDDGETVEQT